MFVFIFHANIPPERIIEVKETISMFLEQWGDVRVVDIQERIPEQTKLDGWMGA